VQKQPTRNIAAKKRAGRMVLDSDYLFARALQLYAFLQSNHPCTGPCFLSLIKETGVWTFVRLPKNTRCEATYIPRAGRAPSRPTFPFPLVRIQNEKSASAGGDFRVRLSPRTKHSRTCQEGRTR
jgi:hypothetical protein